MQTTQETQGALERRIDMSVPMAEIDKEVDSRLKRMARTVKMPGFRPGKVPMKIVAQTYGSQARSEAIGAAVEKAFGDKVREQNLRVAGYPRIEPREAAVEGALEFSAVFEVYPQVPLGDLSGQKVERPVLTVGDAEVDKTIEVLRKQRTTFEAVDRPAQDGDRVVIDFAGRKDGELFEGGKAQDFPFVIGAGSMLKDFESAVGGLKVGETKTFEMTFPEDYHAADLAGQKVEFEITVKGVEAPILPAVDADLARALGVADGDVTKLRDEVRANLEREVKRRIQGKVKEQVMEALLVANPIEVPKALVEAESRQLAENAKRDLEMRGMNTKDIPVEPTWFADQAVRRVKLGLIMAELVNAKELYAKPEQVRAMIDEMAQSYEDPAELVRWYYAQPERLGQAEAVVIEDNVVAWVLSQTQTEDKTVTFDELMGNAA
ncbi:trigger factor [Aromatoleum aromaticum]|uniref:Trigger factor n=1 Tax=Aromatoleum aromaticum (strain DSM 19018 / LMG 30748 / EbN1) TaxID=76114 RepID=TIG_AROAE|nr:trigger factor [Aromatoleum aromaticum]Q5P162.1 RecName: Full=Trigger factor; Short=TF; AltName: Full=PPIase [Aromatoleum aromaticum EbN1]NMG54967.1 trigger factor [Aromatoleum aromaticum]CAI08952.1 Trigger factor (TF) [Aromatoleum aromaticum EbN1]